MGHPGRLGLASRTRTLWLREGLDHEHPPKSLPSSAAPMASPGEGCGRAGRVQGSPETRSGWRQGCTFTEIHWRGDRAGTMGAAPACTCRPPTCRRDVGPRRGARDRETSQAQFKPHLGPKELGQDSETLPWIPEIHSSVPAITGTGYRGRPAGAASGQVSWGQAAELASGVERPCSDFTSWGARSLQALHVSRKWAGPLFCLVGHERRNRQVITSAVWFMLQHGDQEAYLGGGRGANVGRPGLGCWRPRGQPAFVLHGKHQVLERKRAPKCNHVIRMGPSEHSLQEWYFFKHRRSLSLSKNQQPLPELDVSEEQLESVGDRRWGHVNALGWGHRASQQVEPTCPFKSVNLVGLETVSGFRQMVRNGHLDQREPTYCQKVRPTG